MTSSMIARSILLLSTVALGSWLGWSSDGGKISHALIGALIGGALSGGILWLERALALFSSRITLAGFLGFVGGMLIAGLVALVSNSIFHFTPTLRSFLTLSALIGFPYLGVTIGARIGKDRLFSEPSSLGSPGSTHRVSKILDTSVIIDGRIADLCQTGFLEGSLILPNFILKELQNISDSADNHRRARGLRGLDVLHTLMEMETIELQIVHDDFPHIHEADAKLIELAKKREAKIMTNDLNLNRVATLQGVGVLSTHELCYALRPVVLPGEILRVFILKEGKEEGQGIAHLDDGTMVVIDHAKHLIGQNVNVVVTSFIQTNAGRMIFSSVQEYEPRVELSFAPG